MQAFKMYVYEEFVTDKFRLLLTSNVSKESINVNEKLQIKNDDSKLSRFTLFIGYYNSISVTYI